MEMYWFNYKKNDYDFIETPKDFHDYIPQYPAAQNLYGLYIKMGETPINACRKVLEACLGIKND